MLEPRDDLGLAAETLGERLVVEELSGQDLQGDVAVERRLVSLVDGGHAAASQRLEDAIRAERLPGGEH